VDENRKILVKKELKIVGLVDFFGLVGLVDFSGYSFNFRTMLGGGMNQ